MTDKTILVLSGGGMKGLVYIGMLRVFEKINIIKNFHTFIGTSIGALFCSLIILGYDSREIEDFSLKFHFEKLRKLNFDTFFLKYGVDNGDNLNIVLKTLIKQKIGYEYITLSELYNKTKKKLIITTTCIEDEKTYYVSYESDPDMPLYLALRMTMCVPLLYIPIFYYNKHYIDGGCSCNYPIEFFKDRLDEVLGVYISSENKDQKINNFEDYLYQLIKIMIFNDSVRTFNNYKKNTIVIPVNDISFVDFQLTKKKKKELCNIGYKTCLNRFVVTV
jgi:predicted acylesterase/phospholipase RssA